MNRLLNVILFVIASSDLFFMISAQMVFPEPIVPNGNSQRKLEYCFSRTYVKKKFNFTKNINISYKMCFYLTKIFSSVTRAGFPLFTPFPLFQPFPAVVQAQPIQPIVVTPSTYQSAVQTCICVPIGTCTGTTVRPPIVDGTGIIDIRIVNNVKYSNEIAKSCEIIFELFLLLLLLASNSNRSNSTMFHWIGAVLFCRAV